MNAEIAAERPSKRRFEFTACGPSGKMSREAIREVFLVYAAAILFRLAAKVWSRLETKGQAAPTVDLLFAAGGAVLIALAALLFSRMIQRRDYWPVFMAGALAFTAFFRFDKAPIAAGTALEKPLVLLPMLPAALATWAFLAMIRETDELERRINYQALSFAFVVTFAVTLAYALLEDLGLPRVSSFYWWLVLAISWGVGLAIYSRKYR
jgi:CDP-diglyceride synthetase